MISPRILRALGFACVLAIASPAAAYADAGTMVVLVASNAEASTRAIAADYEKSHPGLKIAVSAAGSKVIAAQIAQGAAADLVLISDAVAASMTGVEKPVNVYTTHTVLAVSKSGAAKVKTPKDLANAGVRLGSGTPNSVTEQFANDTFARIGGPDFVAKAQANVITKKTAAEQLARMIDDDSIDAAILLSSDVDAKMTQVALGDKSVSLTYAAAVIKTSPHAAQARELLASMSAAPAQAILRAHHLEPAK
jgi:molybdate transport system substrate-binding protein